MRHTEKCIENKSLREKKRGQQYKTKRRLKTFEGSTGKKGTCHRFDKAKYYFSSAHFPTTIFPLRPCFGLTINKAQGQTLQFVGLGLRTPVFSHGMLYLAL